MNFILFILIVTAEIIMKLKMSSMASMRTVPENPVKEGHTFIGWLPAIETTVITEDTTFVAQWKKNVYKVTFDLNGGVYNGDIDLIQYVEYGGRPDYPENPEKEGYVFKFGIMILTIR